MKELNKLLIKLVSIALIIGNCSQVLALYIPKENDASYYVKEKFLGRWDMQTIVTDSNCPFVLKGTTTESNLEIVPIPDSEPGSKILKTSWQGGRWSKSSGTLKILNNNEAVSERITEYTTEDNSSWKAILIDHLRLNENDTIHSESIVIQYKNNTLVGKYKTYSILTKLD